VIFSSVSLAAYGKAVELDQFYQHGAPRAVGIIALGWEPVSLIQFTHLSKLGYSSQEGRGRSLTTME